MFSDVTDPIADQAHDLAGCRVAIAHDYLTQRGGAERVALELAKAFPGAPFYTSIYNPATTFPEFAGIDVRTSPLSANRAFREDPRRALPFLARAWSNTTVHDVDVVICSSTGWAHGVSTEAPKLVYCHNPARWLYQTDEYLSDRHWSVKAAVLGLRPALRRWDRRNAVSAERYLVNSSVVGGRVREAYGIEATIVHPSAGVSEGHLEPIAGLEPGFLLTVGRARGYKNTDIALAAVQQLPGERLVTVGAGSFGSVSERLVGLTDVSDAQLRWLYRYADALIAPSFEDFGLTVIEAFAQGTPALTLRAGGYLDTMREHVTGEFFDGPTVVEVMDAIQRLRRREWSSGEIRKHAESFSTEGFTQRIRREISSVLGVPAGSEVRFNHAVDRPRQDAA